MLKLVSEVTDRDRENHAHPYTFFKLRDFRTMQVSSFELLWDWVHSNERERTTRNGSDKDSES